MEKHENTPKRRVQRKTFKDLLPLIVIICILFFTSIYFLFPKTQQKSNSIAQTANESNQADQAQSTVKSLSNNGQDSTGAVSPAHSDQSADSLASSPTSQSPADLTSSNPSIQQPIPSPTNPSDTQCDILSSSVKLFFNTLDERAYIREFKLDEKSSIYFPKLIQKLADNPPIVNGETDDLFTILQNTAHFFRIIGKKNILVLKGILDREKETFEQTLADFYALTDDPACLKREFNLSIDGETLYLYSGFFLNTMGGRLYLFRRDSMSRMVVNFYAIMIMEKANREGKNRYGIDVRTPINKLIEDIESSKIQLKLRDYYLDTLYDMKERYN